jgi:LPXTG-motif cell wall-anchored protein
VCEVLVTESGTFTAPSGISKLAAFVVGAGAGGWGSSLSYGSYGGGAGEVVYVDAVEFSSPLDVTVGVGGAGGYYADMEDGGDSSLDDVTAAGGSVGGQMAGGTSGNGFVGDTDVVNCIINSEYSSGGGGATADAEGMAGGAGLVLGDFTDVDTTLFPALDSATVYGAGGDSCSVELVPANTGNGGTAADESAEAGSDGVVIFRYAALTEASLPVESAAPAALAATGPSANSSLGAGAASALFAAGAALLVLVRRRHKNA